MSSDYMRAVSALYGNGAPPPARKRRYPNGAGEGLEAEEHVKFATWLKKQNILFFHPPNGGTRIKREAYRLKQMGVMPGVPDIVICKARRGFHGLYIELKRVEGGTLSPAQVYWLAELTKEGYLARRANGFLHAKRMVEWYLGMLPSEGQESDK